MKANEAPEKIYLDSYGSGFSHGFHTNKLHDNDIEYTRIDVFIEKACNAYCKVCKVPNCRSNECEWISDFKRHLETI